MLLRVREHARTLAGSHDCAAGAEHHAPPLLRRVEECERGLCARKYLQGRVKYSETPEH